MKLKLTRCANIKRSDFASFTARYREQFLAAGGDFFVSNKKTTVTPELILPHVDEPGEKSGGETYGFMFVQFTDTKNPTRVFDGWLADFSSFPKPMEGPDMGVFFVGGTTTKAGVGISQSDYELDDEDDEDASALLDALESFWKFPGVGDRPERLEGAPFRDAGE